MPHPRALASHGLHDIRRFFDQPPLQYLGLELAVCWILDCLLRADSYPTALMTLLADHHPRLRPPEPVPQQASPSLHPQGAIVRHRPAQRIPNPSPCLPLERSPSIDVRCRRPLLSHRPP